MSVTGFGEGVMAKEDCARMYRNTMKRFPKFLNKVETKGGDLYYKKMDFEDAFNKGFKYLEGDEAITNQHDMDLFVQDNIGIKVPLDGPQWRVWFTPLIDEDGKTYTVQIWKSHHSFMDGVSCMGVTCTMMEEYNLSYFVKFTPVPLLQQILLKLSVIIYIPALFADSVFTMRDKNCITMGKKKMNGVICASSSSCISMKAIKDLSKKAGCTVNDILMSATSAAFKSYFRLRGDKLGSVPDHHKDSMMNALMPANIRFEMYPTREAVRMENCFAALPMRIPLVSTMKEAYKPISKVTKKIKS